MEEVSSSELVTTGIHGLDEILRGGLDAGKMYLVTGSPGTGKTTFSLQFVGEGIRRKERCLYIAVGAGGGDIVALAKSAGFHLDPNFFSVHQVEISGEILKGPEQRIFHSAETEPAAALMDLLAEARRVQPQRLVIDSLSDLRLLSDDLVSFRRLVLTLLREFGNGECTTLLINNIGAIEIDSHLETICHGVIRLEQVVSGYGEVRRRLMVLKLRGRGYQTGWHDFRIRRDGICVFPSVLADQQRWRKTQRDQVSTGNERLDALFGGGLDRGTTTTLIGASGTGKTTVASQCVVAAAQRGETAAVYLFEETEDSFRHRAKGLGMAVDEFVDEGLVTLNTVNVAEFSSGEFSHMLLRNVEEKDTRIIVIDSLSGYLSAMSDEKDMTIQLYQLLTCLAHRKVTTLVTEAQHGIFGEQAILKSISYLADAILLLRFFEYRGEIRRAISVIKKRRGVHELTIRELSFSSRKGVSIGEPLVKMQGVLTGVPTLDT